MTDTNPDEIFNIEGVSQYKGESYIDDYTLFMSRLESQGGNMAAGEVGEMVNRMSAHYMRHNIILGRCLKLFSKTAVDIYTKAEDGGKPISAAKAEIIAAATPEAAAYQEAKIHVQNIEMHINSLKALQRGILNEYSYSAT